MESKNNHIISIFLLVICVLSSLIFNSTLIFSANNMNFSVENSEILVKIGKTLSSISIALFISLLFFNLKNKTKILIFILVFGGSFYLNNIYFKRSNPDNEKKHYETSLYFHLLDTKNDTYNKIVDILNPEYKTYNKVFKTMASDSAGNQKLQETIHNSTLSYISRSFNNSLNSPKEIYSKIYLNSKNTDVLDSLWELYSIENDKFNHYNGIFKKEYENKFVSDIGYKPNLSRTEFNEEVNSKSENKKTVDNFIVVPGNTFFDYEPLRIKDIPNGLDEEKWINYVEDFVKERKASLELKTSDIQNMPYYESISKTLVYDNKIITLLSIISLLNFSLLMFFIHKNAGFLSLLLLVLFSVPGLFFGNHYNIPRMKNSVICFNTFIYGMSDNYGKFVYNKIFNDENEPLHIDFIKPEILNISENYSNQKQELIDFNQLTKEFEIKRD